jgi:hypothetical protein
MRDTSRSHRRAAAAMAAPIGTAMPSTLPLIGSNSSA